jgi:hypothetical protein
VAEDAVNHDVLEDSLSDGERRVLDELCELFEVPRDRWRQVPAVAQVFESAAVIRRSRALLKRPAHRASREFCDRLAADSLGLNHKTVESRRHRWRQLGRCPSP